MPVSVWVVPSAQTQAEGIAHWWRENRPAAPGLFEEEYTRVRELLSRAPEAGRRWRSRMVPGVRRVLLPRTRYHLYYVFDEKRSQVIIVAVWSAVRGRGPRFDQITP